MSESTNKQTGGESTMCPTDQCILVSIAMLMFSAFGILAYAAHKEFNR